MAIFTDEFKRSYRSSVVLLLAAAVSYLAYVVHHEFPERIGNDIKKAVEEAVKEELSGIEGRITAAVGKQVAEPFEFQLAGIERRVVDAVLAELNRKEFFCPPEPRSQKCPAATVASNFTLLYDNARLNQDGELDAANHGIRLTADQRRRLDRIANAYKACAQPPSKTVRFKVSGYSSTAEFQAETPDGHQPLQHTNRHNLNTANLRAVVVAAHLQEAGLEAKPVQWESFDELRRPYLDRSNLLQGTDQEALNRSVFIEVENAGACTLMTLESGP